MCRKTRGLGAGRKLRNHRRAQLWADKDYKKSHLGNEWKKPFAGASHAKGIVLEKMCASWEVTLFQRARLATRTSTDLSI